MFRRISISLFLSNAIVFLGVLCIFSAAVYYPVMNNLEKEQERTIVTLTEAVIGSFEAGEATDPNQAVPEVLEADSTDLLPDSVSVQWFDTKGHLLAHKGALALTAPFYGVPGLQKQESPRALLWTKAVARTKKMVGFLRVGMSLAEFDNYRNQLVNSLFWGTILASLSACIGALWLVRQSLRPVENTMNKLTQFTSDASHELRNPLMAVKTNADVALRFRDNMRESDKEKFEMIVDAADQMIKTTTGLLQLAQSEQASGVDDTSALDLSQMIAETAAKLEPLASAKSIIVETDNLEKVLLSASEEDLNIIFGNILENAIQYTEPNGKVTVRSARQGRKVRVEISDTGIGIQKDELPKVFDRFWRSDKARTHRSGGNGLGLALVRATVERYGGSVSVNSEIGHGTTVSVSMPTRVAE